MNFQRFKLDLEKAEETDQIANICWLVEKAREFQKRIYFCFIQYGHRVGHKWAIKLNWTASLTTKSLWLWESQQTVENS